jgi:hypothetical protein
MKTLFSLLFLCGLFVVQVAHAQFAPNQVLRSVDLNNALAAPNITGGTINGAPIGQVVPKAGSFTSLTSSGQITSTVLPGTAPFSILSTTVVPNLNASQLNGTTFAAPGGIGSTTPSTGAFSSLSSAGQILAPDGTNATPSFAFSSSTGTGWYKAGTQDYRFADIGSDWVSIGAGRGGIGLGTGTVNFGTVITSNEFGLTRDAANVLAYRGTTSPQNFRIYNTFTDVNNYERAGMGWNANEFQITTAGLGTGSNTRTISLLAGASSTIAVKMGVSGTFWQINTGSNLPLTPNADNIFDFGSPSFRVHNIYVGSAIYTTAPTAQTSASYTVLTTDNTIRNNVAGTVTLTLPAVASSTGRKLRIITITANTVISNASNVLPLAGGSAGTAILSATAGKWADLECDGSNWIITASN